jgi:hypothetical protein
MLVSAQVKKAVTLRLLGGQKSKNAVAWQQPRLSR